MKGIFFTLTLMWVRSTTSFVMPGIWTCQRAFVPCATSNNNLASLLDRVPQDERYNRWKFLQELLDDEKDHDTVNQVLYDVLKDYLENPAELLSDKDNSSPKMTPEFEQKLRGCLDMARDGKLAIFHENPDEKLEQSLYSLLPDAQDQVLAFKSLWDIVVQIHGREMVKIEESNPTPEWNRRCLVARILIWFDFLTFGTESE